MNVVPAETDQRVVLYNVTWRTYTTFLNELGDRPIRLTYDRGNLEIMSPSHLHEWISRLIGRMIEALAEELGIPMKSGGSTTFKREILDRGFEPDECYWLANEPLVRGREELDFESDPPPDLAVEIDATRSSLNRMGIFAAFKVPEVWRWRQGRVESHHLRADGTYEIRPTSRAFPAVSMADITRFLADSRTLDETTWLKRFREWVRANVVPESP